MIYQIHTTAKRLTRNGDPEQVSQHNVGRVGIDAVEGEDAEKDAEPKHHAIRQRQLQVSHTKEYRMDRNVSSTKSALDAHKINTHLKMKYLCDDT